ncbi:MAG TPA: glutamate-cysteine ligase family protein [Longimicrobium sp.]|nr:glutamate-cysteine ligase family protein [Longimicrobium sp.]
MSPPLDPALLADDLRAHAFAPPHGTLPLRIGAEVELIPVCAETGAQVPICAESGPCTLPLLREFGLRRGWREEASPYGAPRWVLPDGGVVSYEPGGQIEMAGAAFRSASALIRSLRGTVQALRAEAAERGIVLLSCGIAPEGGVEDVPLQLRAPRYERMTAFLRAIGTGGERMMRQTAAMQVSLDWGPAPLLQWRVLNAIAPYVTAVFASSPVYRGQPTGYHSHRARVWHELDGGRTGILPCGADPIAEYRDFALRAPAILLDGGDEFLPFAEWIARGATLDDWRAHLTTLFPEVRPKGFAEVRAADAVDPAWYAAPLVLLAGIACDGPTLRAAADLLGDPDPALLHRAARDGLGDPPLAAVAADLAELALRGAASLPRGFFSGEDLDEAREFFARYTLRARNPADDVLDALAVGAADG